MSEITQLKIELSKTRLEVLGRNQVIAELQAQLELANLAKLEAEAKTEAAAAAAAEVAGAKMPEAQVQAMTGAAP